MENLVPHGGGDPIASFDGTRVCVYSKQTIHDLKRNTKNSPSLQRNSDFKGRKVRIKSKSQTSKKGLLLDPESSEEFRETYVKQKLSDYDWVPIEEGEGLSFIAQGLEGEAPPSVRILYNTLEKRPALSFYPDGSVDVHNPDRLAFYEKEGIAIPPEKREEFDLMEKIYPDDDFLFAEALEEIVIPQEMTELMGYEWREKPL